MNQCGFAAFRRISGLTKVLGGHTLKESSRAGAVVDSVGECNHFPGRNVRELRIGSWMLGPGNSGTGFEGGFRACFLDDACALHARSEREHGFVQARPL